MYEILKPDIKGKIELGDLVEPELEYFRQYCNFSDEELMYFNLKAKGKSTIQITMQMHISESKMFNIARKVRKKILKLI